jgi:asparagine synthetase B (glutamine-hydrolysing)
MCRFGLGDPEVIYAHQAAEVSNTDLKIFDLTDDQAISVIKYAAESALHPFSDFSAIPVAFFLRGIAEERPDCPWVFDGNGGDDCFGISGQGMLEKWQWMTAMPGVFHAVASSFWLRLGLWKRNGLLDIALRKLYQATQSRTYLAPFVFGHTGMTHSDPDWFLKVSNMVEAVCNTCLGDQDDTDMYAQFYSIQLSHVCSRLWTAKTLGPANDLNKSMLYPYLWRDVIYSMSKISWQLKVRNGVAKWPLKKMMEDYMPHDFVYRDKVGFTPPWRRWLRDEKVSNFVRETLLGGTGHVTAILREEWIERILRHLKKTNTNPPTMILNTLWGAVSTELWLQKTL